MSHPIATTILAQLGGNRFAAMTGAKHLVAGERSLTVHLPRGFAAGGIDRVTVTLDASDTYSIAFDKWMARRLELKSIAKAEGVYSDDLRTVFTRHTGLDCTM